LPNPPITLAIVDDDDDVRTALGRLLRSMGHVVKAFASAEAFEAQTAAFDCVIVDVRLPGLSGLELRERLHGRGTPVPVVFITGDRDRVAREAAGPAAPPSITKPFEDVDLMNAIAAAIEAHSLQDSRAH
jgi:FixJ family two-component response regulator